MPHVARPCRRAAFVLAAAVATFAPLAGCGDDDADPTTTTTSVEDDGSTTTTPATETTPSTAAGTVIELTVVGGQVEGGAQRQSVGVGDQVTIRVTSDQADEIHVHGYDLFADVPAGGTGEVAFTADIPGVFEVELEGDHVPLVELEVR